MKKIFFLIFFLVTKITFSQEHLTKCLSTKLINDETTISPSYLDILNSPKKNKGISTQYGPIKYINDDNLPDNAYKLVTKRFQLYFELFSL